MRFALVGNQNCGKTTLFNTLTGSNQHVGNFPGVTVDRKVGEVRGHKECSITDLPGIYSLRPYSAEEIVTRDFLLQEKPDAIVNVVDATCLQRSLYLTLQLMELRIPMVIALNMMDAVRAGGGMLDVAVLSQKLGLPVIPISAAKGEGVDELIHAAIEVAKAGKPSAVYDFCTPGPVHRCLHGLSHLLEDHAQAANLPTRFAAVNFADGNEDIIERLHLHEGDRQTLEQNVVQMERESGMDRHLALAMMRYDFIGSIYAQVVRRKSHSAEAERSHRIDALLTHRIAAIPLFIGIMLLTFYLTFHVIGSFLSDLLAAGIDSATAVFAAHLAAIGTDPIIQGLLIDGVCAGVGNVLSFLPIIVVLFLFLSILEDSGYMARVAFVMDSPLRRIGLSGQSIVPMLMGFGCSVPAIMSTRTLASARDRRITLLLTPYMSCSARLPVYALFSELFFPKYAGLVMTGLYLLGIAVAVLVAVACGHTMFRGAPVPFVLELPPYRLPSLKSTALLLWNKASDFIRRAFTVIFAASVVIWFLQTFGTSLQMVTDSRDSLLATISEIAAPLFAPLGFGDWRAVTALVTGLMAKEAVVSTLQVLLGGAALSTLFTPAAALSFLSFVLLYPPCVAAMAALHRELGSLYKTLLVIVGQCALAWLVAALLYRIALLLL